VGRRKVALVQWFLCRKHVSTSLSNWRGRCVTKACSLFILDKGKPVERPGRKAKGRRVVSGGSLAAERVSTVVSARDEEEVWSY
jgi:hypothetical protein